MTSRRCHPRIQSAKSGLASSADVTVSDAISMLRSWRPVKRKASQYRSVTCFLASSLISLLSVVIAVVPSLRLSTSIPVPFSIEIKDIPRAASVFMPPGRQMPKDGQNFRHLVDIGNRSITFGTYRNDGPVPVLRQLSSSDFAKALETECPAFGSSDAFLRLRKGVAICFESVIPIQPTGSVGACMGV